jgi:hypothetical protein
MVSRESYSEICGNLRDTFAETDRSAEEKLPYYLKDTPHAEAEAKRA